jgi:hypothetical protein
MHDEVIRLTQERHEAEAERDRLREALLPFVSLDPTSPRVLARWDSFVQQARAELNKTNTNEK